MRFRIALALVRNDRKQKEVRKLFTCPTYSHERDYLAARAFITYFKEESAIV